MIVPLLAGRFREILTAARTRVKHVWRTSVDYVWERCHKRAGNSEPLWSARLQFINVVASWPWRQRVRWLVALFVRSSC